MADFALEATRTLPRPRRRRRPYLQAVIATLPMITIATSVFFVGVLFTVYWSFTGSKVFPNWNWVGLRQYVILWSDKNWLDAVRNLAIFGPFSLLINLVVGFLLAVFMDRNIRQESVFRTVFLYPFALSLYVTGLVWQWILNPDLGLQATIRQWGFADFHFAPLTDPGQTMIGLVVAGCWQNVGVTMAILLAGLRSVDQDVWKASRIDGIPAWKAQIFIVLPMMRGAVATALLLQVTTIIRTYDLVVAMSDNPYTITSMPALYVMEAIRFEGSLGRSSAAATMMLLPIAILLLIAVVLSWRRRQRAGINA